MTDPENPRFGVLLLEADELRVLSITIRAELGRLETLLSVARAPGTLAALTERKAMLMSLQTATAEAYYGVAANPEDVFLECAQCQGLNVVRDSETTLTCTSCHHQWSEA